MLIEQPVAPGRPDRLDVRATPLGQLRGIVPAIRPPGSKDRRDLLPAGRTTLGGVERESGADGRPSRATNLVLASRQLRLASVTRADDVEVIPTRRDRSGRRPSGRPVTGADRDCCR